MTTRIELTRALESNGITTISTDHDDPNGPSDYIQWAQVYNNISSFARDGMSVDPDLLMGWHYSDTYLHISTMGAEFIIENLAKYTTDQAAECVARFIAGTYYMSGFNS